MAEAASLLPFYCSFLSAVSSADELLVYRYLQLSVKTVAWLKQRYTEKLLQPVFGYLSCIE